MQMYSSLSSITNEVSLEFTNGYDRRIEMNRNVVCVPLFSFCITRLNCYFSGCFIFVKMHMVILRTSEKEKIS